MTFADLLDQIEPDFGRINFRERLMLRKAFDAFRASEEESILSFDIGFENEKQREPKKGREKNSTKNDIMVLISRLLTYARRNRFCTIVPGTLTIGERTASLAAVVVTRGCVLGVNCYGFGGSIEGKSGSADWVQTLNGERKSFPSPTVKNEEQRKILADVLVDAGYPEVDAQVVGVFTEPKVRFTKVAGKGCYTMDMFRDFLASDMCMRSKDLDPSEIGKKLEAYVKRAKS